VNLGSTEILLIVLVILLLFGPSQIPKMARGFGQAIREFKKGVETSDAGSEPKDTSSNHKDAGSTR